MKHKPIVAFGDSITRGHALSPEHTWPWHLEKNLAKLLGPDAPEVINAGGNGNTTRDGLRRIQPDVLDESPSIVLIEFGGNDAGHNPIDFPDKHVTFEEFVRNLRTIDALVAAAGALPVYLTFTPVVEEWRPNKGQHPFFASAGGPDAFIGTYRQAMRDMAGELQRPLFDLERFVLSQMKTHGPQALIDPDGVHMTVKCNQLIAEALTPRIIEWLP
jgi:isoamyl acetate esterase